MTFAKARVAVLLSALLLAVGLTTAGCVPASPDTDTYANQAKAGLGTVLSEVATVQQVLDLLADGKLPRAAAATQIRYSEDGIGAATSSFTGLNTPVGSDHLANRVNRLLTKAGAVVAQARLAVHRNAEDQYPQIDDSLQSLTGTLESTKASVR